MAEAQGKNIRVRFPPSPTGRLHLGNIRTALYNWLFARQNGGVFLFRIEDTDKERSKPEYEASIIEALNWIGLDWDEGIGKEGRGKPGMKYRQSERVDIYDKYLAQLLAEKKAYYCYCTKEELEADKTELVKKNLPQVYVGRCRNLEAPPVGKEPQVIRFRMPDGKIEFDDIVREHVVFDGKLIGDFAIGRKPGEMPLYHFAVTIDDYQMEITHVIRGEEHLGNTPKQIAIQRALGLPEPTYAHLPLILNANRGKLSKREADTALLDYRDKGYLPAVMLNFLALLGWHPSGNDEIFSKEELIKVFDLRRVQKAGAVFNQEKLDWLNREHMKKMSDEEIAKAVLSLAPSPFAGSTPDVSLLAKIVSVERSRAVTLRDFATLGEFFFKLPEYEASLLIWKESPKEEIMKALKDAAAAVTKVSEGGFNRETLSRELSFAIGERNRGVVLWPLRVALSGQKSSPDPTEIMEVIGKKESLVRIALAQKKFES